MVNWVCWFPLQSQKKRKNTHFTQKIADCRLDSVSDNSIFIGIFGKFFGWSKLQTHSTPTLLEYRVYSYFVAQNLSFKMRAVSKINFWSSESESSSISWTMSVRLFSSLKALLLLVSKLQIFDPLPRKMVPNLDHILYEIHQFTHEICVALRQFLVQSPKHLTKQKCEKKQKNQEHTNLNYFKCHIRDWVNKIITRRRHNIKNSDGSFTFRFFQTCNSNRSVITHYQSRTQICWICSINRYSFFHMFEKKSLKKNGPKNRHICHWL